MHRPTILVQGASGQTGSSTMNFLSRYRDHFNIRAGVTDLSKADKLRGMEGVEVVECDAHRPQTVRNALQGASKVLIIPPNTRYRGNIAKTVAQLASESRTVQHIVLISMVDTEQERIAFQREFRDIERAIEETRIPFTFLRSVLFMENLLAFADEIRNGTLPLPLKNASVSVVAVKDLGECAARILIAPDKIHFNRAYTITGPESLDGHAMARYISGELVYPVRYVDASHEQVARILRNAGTEDWQIQGFLELFDLIAKGAQDFMTDSVRAIVQHTAARFSQWIHEHADYFKARPAQAQAQAGGPPPAVPQPQVAAQVSPQREEYYVHPQVTVVHAPPQPQPQVEYRLVQQPPAAQVQPQAQPEAKRAPEIEAKPAERRKPKQITPAGYDCIIA